jgi:aspartate/methionine/tyrosine aminotransferase
MCIRLKHLNAEKFRTRLLREYGVGVVATSDTDIRIAFSCIEEDRLEEVFDTMLRCAVEMSDGKKGRNRVHGVKDESKQCRC